MEQQNNILQSAKQLLKKGNSVIPVGSNKKPTIESWTQYQERPSSEQELDNWNRKRPLTHIASINGRVSNNQETLDFDLDADRFVLWKRIVQQKVPDLFERLVIQKTPKGKHVIYRCTEPVSGNTKLAHKMVKVDGPGEHRYEGKDFSAKQINGSYYIIPCSIETRGERGYFLHAPSPGYKVIQGNLTDIPTISAKERQTLLDAAIQLNEYIPPTNVITGPLKHTKGNNGLLPGNDFNERGDISSILGKHGWHPSGRSGMCNGLPTKYYRRPGKKGDHSASLIDGKLFYNFSSNGHPFEADRAYPPFAVYALLEHGGNFNSAASQLSKEGYGDRKTEQPKEEKNRSQFEFIHNAEITESLKPIQWRIQGVMEDDTLCNDFGDTGHFKTFVAIDRLLSISSGVDYHGHRVKQGVVFYICGEGRQGIGRRIAAWHIHHGTKASEVPFFVAKTVTDLMDTEAIDGVKRAIDLMAIEYGDPAVIYLDTLARNFGAGDENSTKDMNHAVNNLTTSFGGNMIVGLSHHTGHSNKERARGSIALRAACDHEYRIAYQSATEKILVECKKMKDAPLAPPMLFTPKEILLQIGNQKSSSLVLELDSEGDAVQITAETNNNKMSRNMQRALDALRRLYAQYEDNLAANGREGKMPHVAVKEWREACMGSKIYSRQSSFDRAAESLSNRKCTVCDETGYYIYPIEIKQKYENDVS
jgi:hypothetical protein